ncbi:unnamed protein product [Closterium sp. NIES-64]|nr:unnamed protein product [Closterium sp. NIES-64]
MRRARRTHASSTRRSIRSWQRWSSSTATARASGGYARLHGARKPFRVHSDDPRKRHLHGEGVGVGDEEADEGTLEGSELAERLEARPLEPLLSRRLSPWGSPLNPQRHLPPPFSHTSPSLPPLPLPLCRQLAAAEGGDSS